MKKIMIIFFALFLPCHVHAMTPDDINKAQDLLKRDKLMRQEISQLQKSEAIVTEEIYVPPQEKDKCSDDGWRNHYNLERDGRTYCYAGSFGYHKPLPSYIKDLQSQLTDIDNQLAKLGVQIEEKKK